MFKRLILSLCFPGFLLGVHAQEMLLPLQSNPALKYARQGSLIQPKAGNGYELPFMDDFSEDSVYPSTARWEDHYAFVNRSFGPKPTSVGMVTLDALDDTGAVYSWATSTPFLADYLTSVSIRLDSVISGTPGPIVPADSVYLSFYYQPEGFGNPPDPEDSLILEFYNPVESEWQEIWAIPGESFENFYARYQRNFKLVMIPITNPDFFSNEFQFRFSNYASIANNNLPSWQSNMDQWNLDYVYLNLNRSKTDTVFPDITFVERAPSLLKEYMQMPARQFTNASLKDTMYMTISNLNSNINNISYRYIVKELGGGFTYTKLGGDYDIQPYITSGYHNWPFHTRPALDFTLPVMTSDSTVFEVTHALGINGWADNNISNDTIRHYQRFYNYYAYDDGTAEAGYGLAGPGSRFAYRFTLNQADTLGAVKMFFNQTFSDPSSRYFYLMVWESLSPEKVIYKSSRLRPWFSDSLNKFHTYFIQDTVLTLSGTFYIGWQQITDEVLNIGFDMNTDASANMFYNAEGSWEPTVFNGSVMMQPVMGTAGQSKKADGPDGIEELQAELYPNPLGVGRQLSIWLPDKYMAQTPEENVSIEIFNYLGMKVSDLPWRSVLSLDALTRGYYILRINSFATGESCTRKLLITE